MYKTKNENVSKMHQIPAQFPHKSRIAGPIPALFPHSGGQFPHSGCDCTHLRKISAPHHPRRQNARYGR